MEFLVKSKYDIGDELKDNNYVYMKVIDVKLEQNKYISYLCEYGNKERHWINEEIIKDKYTIAKDEWEDYK
jgi:phage terminase large subunit GpA-like protein